MPTRPPTPHKLQAAIGHVGHAGLTSRSLLRRVAGWLVGVLLLAQMAVAAYACPALSLALRAGDAPQAAAQALAAQAMAAAMPDCSEMAGAVDPGSPNLCAEHCKYGQQSDQVPTLVLPVALLMVLYTTPAPVAVLPGTAAAALDARQASPPGHALLHCVYRL